MGHTKMRTEFPDRRQRYAIALSVEKRRSLVAIGHAIAGLRERLKEATEAPKGNCR